MTDALRIPDHLIAEVKSRTDVRDLASRRTKLTRAGAGGASKGICPFHKERTPSFHVYPDHYHCFGCGAHGSAFDFVMETEGMTFTEAVLDLASAAGVAIEGAPAPPRRKAPAPVVAAETDFADLHRRMEEKRKAAFEKWWRRRLPLKGTVAETYLAEARCIRPQFFRDCASLGFLPGEDFWLEVAKGQWEVVARAPVLLSCLTRADGRFAAVQLTWLEPDGSDKLLLWERPGKRRRVKKTQGAPKGALVRLTPPGPVAVMGEGVETTLSVIDVPELAGRGGAVAGYASCSLDNLAGPARPGGGRRDPRDGRRTLPREWPDMGQPGPGLPAATEDITLLGDGDTKDRLALECLLARGVRRQELNGLRADYAMAPDGKDFNDVLREARNPQVASRGTNIDSAKNDAGGGGSGVMGAKNDASGFSTAEARRGG